MISNMREYFADPEVVASVVQRFMNVTVNEIRNTKNVCHNIRVMTKEIANTEGLDINLLDNMNYTDLITMLEMSRDTKYTLKYNASEELYTSEVYNLFIYKVFLLIILGAAQNAIPIRLFLELPVKEFYAYVESISNQEDDYTDIAHEVERLHGEFREDMTIKELFMKVREKVCRDWGIVDKSIEAYKQMMLDELMLVRKVFALKFMDAFPERFDADWVRLRYAEIWDDCEEWGD